MEIVDLPPLALYFCTVSIGGSQINFCPDIKDVEHSPPSSPRRNSLSKFVKAADFGKSKDHNPKNGNDLPGVLNGNFCGRVISRVPFQNRSNDPLPPGISLFCHPLGIKLSRTPSMPIFFTFASTSDTGSRLYGHVLTFYETLSPSQADLFLKLQKDKFEEENTSEKKRARVTSLVENACKNGSLYIPVSLCIVSRGLFPQKFKDFLTMIYRLSLSELKLPIERYIGNFVLEVPFPPSGRTTVQYRSGNRILEFVRPPPNDPFSSLDGLPIELLFRCLRPSHVLLVWKLLLLERQIVLHSSQFSLLTLASEVLLALLYPISWKHVYIPLLSITMLGVLNAPVPFFVGLHSSLLPAAETELCSSAVVVDLDNDTVNILPKHGCVEELPSLPRNLPNNMSSALQFALSGLRAAVPAVPTAPSPERVRWLRTVLLRLDSAAHSLLPCDEDDDESSYEDNASVNWSTVRRVFFNGIVSIFKDYRTFMIFEDERESELSKNSARNNSRRQRNTTCFDINGFLRQAKQGDCLFLEKLFKTQAIQVWLNERAKSRDPAALDDYKFQFFDESIDARYNYKWYGGRKARAKATPFLFCDFFGHRNTVMAPSPDTKGITENLIAFKYERFPIMQSNLFRNPRPAMIREAFAFIQPQQTLRLAWRAHRNALKSSGNVISKVHENFKRMKRPISDMSVDEPPLRTFLRELPSPLKIPRDACGAIYASWFLAFSGYVSVQVVRTRRFESEAPETGRAARRDFWRFLDRDPLDVMWGVFAMLHDSLGQPDLTQKVAPDHVQILDIVYTCLLACCAVLSDVARALDVAKAILAVGIEGSDFIYSSLTRANDKNKWFKLK
eukprot:g824.t1